MLEKLSSNFGFSPLIGKVIKVEIFHLCPEKNGYSGKLLMLKHFGHLKNFYST
jgi:hypothetical protein